MLSKKKAKKHNPFSEKYHPNIIFIIKFLIVFLSLTGVVLFLCLLIKGTQSE